MKSVDGVAYRYVTDTDFFNIYKPPGTEAGGGGQTYIDFPSRGGVSVSDWTAFFDRVVGLKVGQVTNGPAWTLPVHSIGVADTTPVQQVHLYQRRAANVVVAAQNINTRDGNRVNAWDSSEGFPEPEDPALRGQRPDGLVVYLVRTSDREVWAGWFQNVAGFPSPARDAGARGVLSEMIDPANLDEDGAAGFIDTRGSGLAFEETVKESPFFQAGRVAPRIPAAPPQRSTQVPPQRKERTEDEVLTALFGDDEADGLEGSTQEQRVYVAQVRRRNTRAANALKELYGYECQATGDKYVFAKRNGLGYVEAHHLVPLGAGGADNPRNIVVVSAQLHRMLHYANVQPDPIDLSRIAVDEDGWGYLDIVVNDSPLQIRWHPGHASRVIAEED